MKFSGFRGGLFESPVWINFLCIFLCDDLKKILQKITTLPIKYWVGLGFGYQMVSVSSVTDPVVSTEYFVRWHIFGGHSLVFWYSPELLPSSRLGVFLPWSEVIALSHPWSSQFVTQSEGRRISSLFLVICFINIWISRLRFYINTPLTGFLL